MTDLAPNKHQQKTEITRRKLLKAARRIFARNGFEAARIESVAAEAGYTRGAFYAHFKSKEDLFFALVAQQATQHLEKLRGQLERCKTDAERFACVRKYYVGRIADKEWPILVTEFKLYALRHGRLRAKLAEAHRNIRQKLKLESIARLLPPSLRLHDHDRQLQRSVLEGLLHGTALECAYDPASMSEEELAIILGDLFDTVVRASRRRTAS